MSAKTFRRLAKKINRSKVFEGNSLVNKNQNFDKSPRELAQSVRAKKGVTAPVSEKTLKRL